MGRRIVVRTHGAIHSNFECSIVVVGESSSMGLRARGLGSSGPIADSVAGSHWQWHHHQRIRRVWSRTSLCATFAVGFWSHSEAAAFRNIHLLLRYVII